MRDAEVRAKKYKNEIAGLSENMVDAEDNLGRLEILKKHLEVENNKIKQSLETKESTAKVLYVFVYRFFIVY